MYTTTALYMYASLIECMACGHLQPSQETILYVCCSWSQDYSLYVISSRKVCC